MVCCQACGSYFEDISALSNHFQMRLQCRTKGNYDLFKMHGNHLTLPIHLPTAVVADLSIVCAVEREVRGSIPVWEYVLQGPMSEFETR